MIRSIDMRGWAMIGLFALTVLVLAMIYAKPELTRDQVFVLLAQGIVMGGLIGNAIAFLFGASKREPPPPDPQS